MEPPDKPKEEDVLFGWDSPQEAVEDSLDLLKQLRNLLEPLIVDLGNRELTHAYGDTIVQFLRLMEEDLTELRNYFAELQWEDDQ